MCFLLLVWVVSMTVKISAHHTSAEHPASVVDKGPFTYHVASACQSNWGDNECCAQGSAKCAEGFTVVATNEPCTSSKTGVGYQDSWSEEVLGPMPMYYRCHGLSEDPTPAPTSRPTLSKDDCNAHCEELCGWESGFKNHWTADELHACGACYSSCEGNPSPDPTPQPTPAPTGDPTAHPTLSYDDCRARCFERCGMILNYNCGACLWTCQGNPSPDPTPQPTAQPTPTPTTVRPTPSPSRPPSPSPSPSPTTPQPTPPPTADPTLSFEDCRANCEELCFPSGTNHWTVDELQIELLQTCGTCIKACWAKKNTYTKKQKTQLTYNPTLQPTAQPTPTPTAQPTPTPVRPVTHRRSHNPWYLWGRRSRKKIRRTFGRRHRPDGDLRRLGADGTRDESMIVTPSPYHAHAYASIGHPLSHDVASVVMLLLAWAACCVAALAACYALLRFREDRPVQAQAPSLPAFPHDLEEGGELEPRRRYVKFVSDRKSAKLVSGPAMLPTNVATTKGGNLSPEGVEARQCGRNASTPL